MEEESSTGAGDRRHADRTHTPALTLTLVLPAHRLGPARLFRRVTRRRRVRVEVLDLSLGGVRIRLPEGVTLSLGAIVHLEIEDGSDARAVVRHCTARTAQQVCGLEFTGFHNPATSPFFHRLIEEVEDLQLSWDDPRSPGSSW